MEFVITLGWAAWLAIIVAAVAFGLVAQYIGEARTGYEWLVDAVAFGIGAVVASEFIVDFRAFEPVWDQLAIVPAVVGGLVVGILVELATRMVTGGTYGHQGMAA